MMGMATDYPHGTAPLRKDQGPEDKAREDHAETRTGTTSETVPNSFPAEYDPKSWKFFLRSEKFGVISDLFVTIGLVFIMLILLLGD